MLKNKLVNTSEIVIGAILLAVFVFISFENYLLFHSAIELFSIVIAIGTFMIFGTLKNR